MTHAKTQNQLIFDPIFTDAIKDACISDPPEGSISEDFHIAEVYGVLAYNPDKEAQALEMLFTSVGKAWHEAKLKAMEKEE